MRRTLIGATLLSLALSAGAALANGVVDAIMGDLRAQGYLQIDISRTLLGRTRIEAESKAHRREIILDPRTGEILRDYWEVLLDAAGRPIVGSASSPSLVGSGGGSSGSGSDDDDDDDDDDNSGSGSGSSGSGGNSGSGGSGGNSGSGGGSSDDD